MPLTQTLGTMDVYLNETHLNQDFQEVQELSDKKAKGRVCKGQDMRASMAIHGKFHRILDSSLVPSSPWHIPDMPYTYME